MRAEASTLKGSVSKLQADDGFDCLNQLLGDWGLKGWIRNLVKIGLHGLYIVLYTVIIFHI